MMTTVRPLLQIFQNLDYDKLPMTKQEQVFSAKRAQYRVNTQGSQQMIIFSNGIQSVQTPNRRKLYSSKRTRHYCDSDEDEVQQEEQSYAQAKAYQYRKFKKGKQSDPDYMVKNQKKDRNVVSNIIHHFFRYVKQKSTIEIIKKIIVCQNMNITYDNFEKSFKALSYQFKTYITQKHLKNLWNNHDPQLKDVCLILRILSRKFLSKQCFLSIYFGNKLSRSSKMIHYKGKRQLLKQLLKMKNKLK